MFRGKSELQRREQVVKDLERARNMMHEVETSPTWDADRARFAQEISPFAQILALTLRKNDLLAFTTACYGLYMRGLYQGRKEVSSGTSPEPGPDQPR